MPTRILYVEHNRDGTVGGSHHSLLYLLRGLDRRRWEPLVAFYEEHALLPEFRRQATEVAIVRRRRAVRLVPEAPASGGTGRLLRLPGLAAQRAVNLVSRVVAPALASARWLRSRRVRIVHLSNSLLHGHEWMLAARLAGARCVVHQRGYGYGRAVNRHFSRLVDAVICVSDDIRRDLERERLPRRGPLLTVHNGIDVDEFASRCQRKPAEIRAEFGMADADPLIGIVGNIRAWKGQHVVLEAMRQLAARYPGLTCLVVGPVSALPADVRYARDLRAFVAEHDLERRVLFTGYRPDVADLMNGLDILVQASVEPEPFGRTLLEGMALGKIIVASDLGGNRESVEHDVSGLLVRPGDGAALAAGIAQVLDSPELAWRLADGARRRVAERFTVERMAERVQDVYEALLRGRAA